MISAFECGIGAPQHFKVSYGKSCTLIRSREDETFCPPRFCVASADLRLKLYFSVADGLLCGFSYRCGDIGSIPRKTLTTSYSPDGYVKASSDIGRLDGVTYVAMPAQPAFYDCVNKILLVGDGEEKDICYFRICQNVYFATDSCGNFHSAYIIL